MLVYVLTSFNSYISIWEQLKWSCYISFCLLVIIEIILAAVLTSFGRSRGAGEHLSPQGLVIRFVSRESTKDSWGMSFKNIEKVERVSIGIWVIYNWYVHCVSQLKSLVNISGFNKRRSKGNSW